MAFIVRQIGPREFIALMAITMSMVAMSIDVMLPALSLIADDLNAKSVNDRQLIIGMLFLGLSCGQLVYGPISDTVGRRSPMIVGFAIFLVGCVMSALAESFAIMLVGRFLQGLGAAGPRIMSVTIIRDHAAGVEMARIMSLVMMIFILVPILAPSVGQLVLFIGDWRIIFWLLVAMAALSLIWFVFRQPETLKPDDRNPLKLSILAQAFAETVSTRQTLVNTLAAGLVFGAFLGYINSSQQILQELFSTGEWFPIYFGALAAAIGISSYFNSRLVVQFGLRPMCRWSLIFITAVSAVYLIYILFFPSTVWLFMIWLSLCFLAIGALFSNFHALAMEPMGHIAGMASSVTSAIMTLISVVLSYFIGQAYNESVVPLVIAFIVLHLLALGLILKFDHKFKLKSGIP